MFRAYLYTARLFYRSNRRKEACKAYHQAVRLPFSYENQNRAVYASAKCLKKEGDLKGALELLESRLRSKQETLAHKKKMAKLQWQFVRNEKNFKPWKVKILSHIIYFDPQQKKVNLVKQKAIEILEQLDPIELLKLAPYANEYRSFEGFILFLSGEVKWGERDLSQAKFYFKQALTNILEPDIEKKIQYYLKIIQAQKEVNPKRIGVILPMTGKRKNLGRKILRGLQLGLGLPENSPYQLVVMDSKNHPDVAKSATEKLLSNHHVIALVGGLSGETAEAIADTASGLGIPALLFSQKAELTKNRQFVFQNAVTSESLVKKLLSNIFEKTKMKNFSILYPEDSYGREYKLLFEKEVEKHEGLIVSAESYKPEETDFKDPLKKLIGLYDLETRQEEYEQIKEEYLKNNPLRRGREKKIKPENLLKPIIEFDALFIPDSIIILRKIADHFKYFGVKNINLLGTNLWKPSNINSWAKDFSLFFINSLSLKRKEMRNSPFYTNYRKEFRFSPGLFEERAFNTGVALRTILDQGSKNRVEAQKNLQSLKNLQGAYFPFEISESRVFTYPLEVYVSQENTALPLDSIPVLEDSTADLTDPLPVR